MTPKTIGYSIGALALSAAVGYGFGRYATPAKVVTVTKTETKVDVQWKDRIVEKVVQGPVRTVTHTIERLVACTDGASTPTTDTTITVDAGPVVIDRVDTGEGTGSSTTKSETKTVTIFSQPKLMLQGGIDLRKVWDTSVSYRLMGPGWLGLAYRNDLTVKPLDRLTLRASFTF